MNFSPKRSIRLRFTLIVLAVLLASMGIQLLLNMYFLETYYQNDKKNTAIKEINALNEIMDRYGFDGSSDNIDSDMQEEVEEVLQNCWNFYNMSFIILSTGNEPLFNYSNRNDDLYDRFRDLIFEKGNDVKILYENSYYKVTISHNRNGSRGYLSGFGFLNCGCSFLVSMPVDSIRNSADISNRFFLYVGLVVLIIAVLLTNYLMYRLTKPVKELSHIASSMANLDFNASYTGKAQDEIGELGTSMNHMAMILKSTIEELQEANTQLQKDNEQLQKVDEMRKEFLSGVSHELKTPIAIIQGYAEGLQDCINEDEESRAFYCDVIMDEAVKMNRMVQKLLKLNQLEFGTSMLDLISFDMNELIENMMQTTNVLIADKMGRMEYKACQSELWVEGDTWLIEEVLQNYISNACNHLTDQGLIQITSELRPENMVRISVFNEGEPIPEEALDQVWIKFFKVDKARTRAYGGSGIGLSLVKAIMDQHGCDYGVANVENGVTFWFELPLGEKVDYGID